MHTRTRAGRILRIVYCVQPSFLPGLPLLARGREVQQATDACDSLALLAAGALWATPAAAAARPRTYLQRTSARTRWRCGARGVHAPQSQRWQRAERLRAACAAVPPRLRELLSASASRRNCYCTSRGRTRRGKALLSHYFTRLIPSSCCPVRARFAEQRAPAGLFPGLHGAPRLCQRRHRSSRKRGMLSARSAAQRI